MNGDQTPSVEVTPCETLSEITKCERCWRYTNDVASDSRYPTVCARCATALDEIGYEPYTVTQEQPV
ncbi:zinc finger domain-containing protein [Terriglobus sp. YAF25]|uniref:zinc finger domain-containing protein n=1 Tax=Terriglobus sp. YAF25 TaxID=3233080 RepID=UPI003F9B13A2